MDSVSTQVLRDLLRGRGGSKLATCEEVQPAPALPLEAATNLLWTSAVELAGAVRNEEVPSNLLMALRLMLPNCRFASCELSLDDDIIVSIANLVGDGRQQVSLLHRRKSLAGAVVTSRGAASSSFLRNSSRQLVDVDSAASSVAGGKFGALDCTLICVPLYYALNGSLVGQLVQEAADKGLPGVWELYCKLGESYTVVGSLTLESPYCAWDQSERQLLNALLLASALSAVQLTQACVPTLGDMALLLGRLQFGQPFVYVPGSGITLDSEALATEDEGDATSVFAAALNAEDNDEEGKRASSQGGDGCRSHGDTGEWAPHDADDDDSGATATVDHSGADTSGSTILSKEHMRHAVGHGTPVQLDDEDMATPSACASLPADAQALLEDSPNNNGKDNGNDITTNSSINNNTNGGIRESRSNDGSGDSGGDGSGDSGDGGSPLTGDVTLKDKLATAEEEAVVLAASASAGSTMERDDLHPQTPILTLSFPDMAPREVAALIQHGGAVESPMLGLYRHPRLEAAYHHAMVSSTRLTLRLFGLALWCLAFFKLGSQYPHEWALTRPLQLALFMAYTIPLQYIMLLHPNRTARLMEFTSLLQYIPHALHHGPYHMYWAMQRMSEEGQWFELRKVLIGLFISSSMMVMLNHLRAAWYVFLLPVYAALQCTMVRHTIELLRQNPGIPAWVHGPLAVPVGYAVTLVSVWLGPMYLARRSEQRSRSYFLHALKRELRSRGTAVPEVGATVLSAAVAGAALSGGATR